MTPAEALITRLGALGVGLSSSGRLIIEAPRGVITEELRERISQLKPAILAELDPGCIDAALNRGATDAETPHPALIRLSKAEQALAQARDLSEIKNIIDIAEAARVWARAAKYGEDCARQAEEIKLKAQRKAGEFLAQTEKSKGGRANSAQLVRSSSEYRQAMEAASIDRGSAQRWQQVAAVPAPIFQNYIDSRLEAGEEINTAGLLREAKAHRNGALLSSDSPDWYTPPHVIECVKGVLGVIDLDPCSNSHEHPNVPAATHFTLADDGLSRPWFGKVYLNPPYGDAIDWVQKLITEYSAGRVTEAVLLVAARTGTKWFRLLRDFPVCFIAGRLKFIGGTNSATFPSAVIYLGPQIDRFQNAFARLGDTYELRKQGAAGVMSFDGGQWTELNTPNEPPIPVNSPWAEDTSLPPERVER